MGEKANHTIVLGEGAKQKMIAAGEQLPGDLPPDEMKRLRDLGAIGSALPGEAAIDFPITMGPAGKEADGFIPTVPATPKAAIPAVPATPVPKKTA